MSRGYVYIISNHGETLRVSTRKIGFFIGVFVFFVLCLVLSIILLFNFVSEKFLLEQKLDTKEKELSELRTVNQEYQDYIEKIQLELEEIRSNFEMYKLEVKGNVQEEEVGD